MLLASYALQAEVGDYNQTLHGSDYFVPEHYLPQRVRNLIVQWNRVTKAEHTVLLRTSTHPTFSPPSHTQVSAHTPSLLPEENLQYYEAIGIFLCYSFCMYEENGKVVGSLVIFKGRHYQEMLFNESACASVLVDYRGLFGGRCPRITGFNWSDFSKRVFNTLSTRLVFSYFGHIKTC